MPSNIVKTAGFICEERLIAIVEGNNFPFQKLIEIGDALLAAPVLVMGVTLNTSEALDCISALRQRFGHDMLVGAGTVRTVQQFDDAVAAGAQFTVAPNFELATVERSLARDILHLPGVYTPTEAQTAYAAGCRWLHLFPSDSGGPKYLQAIRAPLDDVQFIPSGGVTLDNVAEYFRAGAAAVGLGSALVSGPDQPMADLINRARKIRNVCKETQAI